MDTILWLVMYPAGDSDPNRTQLDEDHMSQEMKVCNRFVLMAQGAIRI